MRSHPDSTEVEFAILSIFLAIGFVKMVVGAIFAIAAAL